MADGRAGARALARPGRGSLSFARARRRRGHGGAVSADEIKHRYWRAGSVSDRRNPRIFAASLRSLTLPARQLSTATNFVPSSPEKRHERSALAAVDPARLVLVGADRAGGRHRRL